MTATTDTDLLASLRALDATFGRCIAGRDARALAEQFYAEDALLLPPGQPEIRGRAAIAAFWAEMLANGLAEASIETASAERYGDVAHAFGTGAGTIRQAGLDEIRLDVKYVLILKRQADGAWKVSVDIWNETN